MLVGGGLVSVGIVVSGVFRSVGVPTRTVAFFSTRFRPRLDIRMRRLVRCVVSVVSVCATTLAVDCFAAGPVT